MKSSTGEHFVGLDHVRAMAALLVFCWHFLHEAKGYPVAFEGAPGFFPLALFDEGHVGVSLFMVLSGYLFSKLLCGHDISYPAFLWNRSIRLAPLLIVAFTISGIAKIVRGGSAPEYLRSLVEGFLLPTWPNGGWSVAVELHFYILLPALLSGVRRVHSAPLLLVAFAVILRWFIYQKTGEIQFLAYWTIVGRIDQFCFGILAFYNRDLLKGAHLVAVLVFAAFSAFYWTFDWLGGDYQMKESLGWMWVIVPTIEAASFSVLVAYYDVSYSPQNIGLSGFVSRIGTYSFSIYLLHFYFVFKMSRFVQEYVMDISNFYLALAWAVASFLLLVPVGYISYELVEKRFLRFRKKYIVANTKASPLSHDTLTGIRVTHSDTVV